MKFFLSIAHAIFSLALIVVSAPVYSAGTGTISGSVKDAETGDPIPFLIEIFDKRGEWLNAVPVSASGNYTIINIPVGEYRLVGNAPAGYIDVIYPNEDCGRWCGYPEVLIGELVTVTEGAEVSGVDLSVRKGATLSLSVKDSQTKESLVDQNVDLYDAAGDLVTRIPYSSASNQYELVAGLEPGDYYLQLESTEYQVAKSQKPKCITDACRKIWPGYQLNKLTITDNVVVQHELLLEPLGADGGFGYISGRVYEKITGVGIASVKVEFYSPEQGYISVLTDKQGNYTSIPLPEGRYLVGVADKRYVAQCYGTPPCNIQGRVQVAANNTRSSINFSLEVGGKISGVVTDQATGAFVDEVSIEIYSRDGRNLDNVVSDANGYYESNSVLSMGQYIVCASPSTSLDYIRVCRATSAIDVQATGVNNFLYFNETVNVFSGELTENVNFQLLAGGRIAGTVLNQADSQPVSGAYIFVYDDRNNYVTYTRSAVDGSFQTPANLVSGDYFLTVSARHFVEQCGDRLGGSCNEVGIDGLAPLKVTLGSVSSGMNIHLTTDAKIIGRIVDKQTQEPIPGLRINKDALPYLSDNTDVQGRYFFVGLAPGEHVLYTNNQSGYYNVYLQGGVCNEIGCSLESAGDANKIVVDKKDVKVIEPISLEKGPSIIAEYKGTYNPKMMLIPKNRDIPPRMFPFKNYIARTPGLPAGDYLVRTVNYSGNIDHYQNGSPVAGILPNGIQPLTVTGTSDDDFQVSFELAKGYLIYGKIRILDDSPLSDYSGIAIFDSNGTWMGAGVILANGTFTTVSGLPSGKYYLGIKQGDNIISLHDSTAARTSDWNGLPQLDVTGLDVDPITVGSSHRNADVWVEKVNAEDIRSPKARVSEPLSSDTSSMGMEWVLLFMLGIIMRRIAVRRSQKLRM